MFLTKFHVRVRGVHGLRFRRFAVTLSSPCDAVVKIFNTRQRPGWTVPWQMQPVETSSGSGAVVHVLGRFLVLTAAHVVSDARHLQIQRSLHRFSGEKFRARIVAVCHDVDLALLSIDEEQALEDIVPLELSSADGLPNVFDKVHVVGYPVGGDAVSVTEGVLSRVEVQEYSHSLRPGLALTVDAAINSGNSGGPVLDTSERMIGVAFQKMVARGVELQGHAVPMPLISRFLQDVNDASASSSLSLRADPLRLFKPSLGCDLQALEAAAFRDSLGLQPTQSGVLVTRLHYSGQAPALRAGDVLLAFDGLPLDNLGFCSLLGRRLHFAAARDLQGVGSVVPLTVWREGGEMIVTHELRETAHFIHRGQHDCAPQFFICAGLVFQPLSHEYLQGWSPNDRPSHLQTLFLNGQITPERTEAVIVSHILADEVNAGYDSGWVGAPVVRSINGTHISNLSHLAAVVREAQGSDVEFLHIEMDTAYGPSLFVLRVAGIQESQSRIHELYGVPACCCSPDLA